MQIILPDDVQRIIRVLQLAGHEAYAVGGCVRDSLIGRIPADWDITTSAKPEEVKALFRRTVDTGLVHGTVTVMLDKTGYEVTTYRIDGEYADSRHPDNVTFTSELSEDLLRRDFTINAMAYNDADGLQDLFGGTEDLEKGIIRAVGVPEERFTEDALRILRCIRFSAQLGFSIEEETLKAAEKLAPRLAAVSQERIREELMKTLMSDHPGHIALFDDIGAMFCIRPDFHEFRTQCLEKLENCPKDRILRLAAFLSGDSEKEAEKILKDLRFDNDTSKRVVRLIRFLPRDLYDDDKDMRHLLSEYGTEDIEGYLIFKEREVLISRVREILSRGDCISLKTLAVTGSDLIACGIKPGKELGASLQRLLNEVLDDPALNTREKLLELV